MKNTKSANRMEDLLTRLTFEIANTGEKLQSWYCSCMFHDVTGMTMKSYVARRRLTKVTEEIRDTKERILDIAIRYGFSSQEALTRVFKEQYGCTPAAYRR